MTTLTEMKKAPTIGNFKYLRKKVDQFRLWEKKEKFRKEVKVLKAVVADTIVAPKPVAKAKPPLVTKPKATPKPIAKAKPKLVATDLLDNRFDRSIKMPLSFADLTKAEYSFIIKARRGLIRARAKGKVLYGYDTDKDHESIWGGLSEYEQLKCFRLRVGFEIEVYAELVPSLKKHYFYVERTGAFWTAKAAWAWFETNGYCGNYESALKKAAAERLRQTKLLAKFDKQLIRGKGDKPPLTWDDLSTYETLKLMGLRQQYALNRWGDKKYGKYDLEDFKRLPTCYPGGPQLSERLSVYRLRQGYNIAIYAEMSPSIKENFDAEYCSTFTPAPGHPHALPEVYDTEAEWASKNVWQWLVSNGYA